MSFVRLVLAEAGPSRLWLILATAASGVSMGVMLVVVNTVMDNVQPENASETLIGLFIAACLGFIVAKSYALNLVTFVVENMIDGWRARVVGAMRHMDLASFERIGRDRISLVMTRELQVLSSAGPSIVHAATTSIMLVVTSLYVAGLSLLAFLAIVLALATAVQLYRLSQARTRGLVDQYMAAESAFSASFNHMLNGFRETKLSSARSDDLYVNYARSNSELATNFKIDAGRRMALGDNVINLVFYMLVGFIVFVLPYSVGSAQTAGKLINVVLFAVGAVELVVRGLPMMDRSGVAIDTLEQLERDIRSGVIQDERRPSPSPPGFETIDLRDLVYSHHAPDGEASFVVGPIRLTVRRGEVVFIVGGNGSGKSTLLMLLTRLYEPERGHIVWDDEPVDARNARDYRHLFSAIFSDFHLFDRLYGFPQTPDDTVEALIDEYEMSGKVGFSKGRFSTLDLSTGQRKRVALAVAVLEDRPVLVFDEWAADQDPRFRRYFYETLIPAFRDAGKTVIAVTHDDRFFSTADRVLVMDAGMLREVEVAA